MNFMSNEEKKDLGSATADAGQASDQGAKAGNPDDLIKGKPDPNSGVTKGQSGEQEKPSGTDTNQMQKVSETEEYKSLEKKLGEQGNELGEYREFVTQVTPLMEILEKNPEVTKALLNGKIDNDLAIAASEGKITLKDAEMITEAHTEVKKDLGTKGYEKLSSSDIEKLIESKAKELVKQANDDTEKKFSQRISDSEDRRDFERDFQDYIDKNSDVVQYLPEINKWFDENPDQYRIDIAHAAVKVKVLSAQQAKSDEEDAAEAAKNVASNAAGGGSQNATMIDDKETIDKLIMGKSNPNSL